MKESVSKKVARLEREIAILTEAVEMLSKNCTCSVKERMSGHNVDCWAPDVQELLRERKEGAA